MGILWDLRIDHPQECQNLPSSRLKMKPFDLCSQLYRSPPYKCISWSDDNMIAFSPVEQLIYSHSMDHIGNIQRPIYIVLPEIPESHITLVTSHMDTIRILEWSKPCCGGHLLSVDMRDKACVWRMKDSVNEWVCVHEINTESVIAAKWVTFDKESRLHANKSFALPCGTPCFIIVSAFTRVTLWYYSSFDGWISLYCNLGPTLGYSQTHLARADIIDTSAGTVLVGVSGPCVGNTIGMYPPPSPSAAVLPLSFRSDLITSISLFEFINRYEITFDLNAATMTGKLKSRVELSLPLPEIPPSVLLGPVSGVPSLIHMEFDPESDGNALITLVAGLSPHYQPPKLPQSPSGSEEGSYVGNVQLERWEYSTIPVFKERQFLLPLSTLPAVKDSETLAESLWMPIASVSLDLPSSPAASNVSILRDRAHAQPEWVAGLNPYFGTLFKCTPHNVCLGFLGGGVEIRDILTLAPRGVVEDMTQASEAPHSSTLTMFGSNPPIPVSGAISPNGECFATLRYDATIRLSLMPMQARPIQRPGEVGISKERQAADSLEFSMLRGSDPWDIFIRMLHDPVDNFLHLGVCDCHLICILAAQDLHALDDLLRGHYALRWEPLRASLYTLCDHTPNSLSYVTSSSRAYIYYISDILRSSLAFPLPTSFIIPLNLDDLVNAVTSLASSQSTAVYFPPSMVASFAPLEEWVMNFVTLLLRALSIFVMEMNSSRSKTINSVICSHVPATAPGYPIPKPNKPIPPIPHKHNHSPQAPAELTPELSLTSMATLTNSTSTSLPPAPLIPREYPLSPTGRDGDAQTSTSPTPNYPTSSTEAPSTSDTSPSTLVSTPVLATNGTPTPPSPDVLGAPPLLVESTTPPPPSPSTEAPPEGTAAATILSPPTAISLSPTLNVPPSLTATPPSSRSHARSSVRPPSSAAATRVPLDYHFEFLLAVSSLDAPLASILFDIPTLQTLQNMIALVGLTAATPVPGKAEKYQLKDIRSKHHLVGSIIAKLQTLLDKDPNYHKIEFAEVLALRYAEALAEFVVAGDADELRTSIAHDLRALNLDNPFTPLVHRAVSRPPNTPIPDVLHFVPFMPEEGPFRECLRCGRATRGNAPKGATLWAERWTFVCPICNGKWYWVS